METYDEWLEALQRCQHYNRVAGSDKYRVTGTVDGKWAVWHGAVLGLIPIFPASKTVH